MQGIQPDYPEGIQAIAKVLDIADPESAIIDPNVKATLRVDTERAINDSVFGVPSFVVNQEIFWGGDATDMLLDHLDNPGLFQTSEMKRISNMPMGKTRKK